MTKRTLLSIIAVAVIAVIVVAAVLMGKEAEAPADASWHRTFGGMGDEAGLAVRQTPDGGFIIAGLTTSFGEGGSDAWLIKTDTQGQNLWDKAYGGKGDESALALAVLPDGYIIAGYTTSFGSGGQDAWLVRTDSGGGLVWDKTFGGAGSDSAASVMATSDGGFVVAGTTNSAGSGDSDGWLFKVDASGNQVWSWTYGGTELDYLRSVNGTADGGLVALGNTSSFGNEGDIWLLKTDAGGITSWQKRYRGQGEDFSVYAAQAPDGGYLIAGTGLSAGADSDYWLIKADAVGDNLWSRTYGGNQDDVLEAARLTPNGMLLLGRTYSGDVTDIWLMVIDTSGNKVWEEVAGGEKDDTGLSIQEVAGGYIIAGQTSSYGNGGADVWLVKVAAD